MRAISGVGLRAIPGFYAVCDAMKNLQSIMVTTAALPLLRVYSADAVTRVLAVYECIAHLPLVTIDGFPLLIGTASDLGLAS